MLLPADPGSPQPPKDPGHLQRPPHHPLNDGTARAGSQRDDDDEDDDDDDDDDDDVIVMACNLGLGVQRSQN